NLMALRLFRTIRIDEDKSRDPRVAVRIRVIEAPRHEVRFGVGYDTEEQLRGLAGWRDYDLLGGARQLGFTARASFLRRSIGADWNWTDDLLDPTRGWVTSASVEPVGGFLGGKFSFVRLQGEGRRYQPLVADLAAAFRFRLGAEEPFGGSRDVPLFERLYAGGIGSVRGYERRHVGPLIDDDPVGGRSLVEGSAELRHPVTERLGAALFAGAGQGSLRSLGFPLDDLRYGFGFGVRYKSPVGPLRVDLGFPLEP